MNRGVEMVVDPHQLPGCLIQRQVANGVSVRMAVLYDALIQDNSPDVVDLDPSGKGAS
jgi:aspartate carbamoyltransferase catalytic subunit